MRFLVFSKMNTPIPPDLAMPLFDAMDRFMDSMLKSGKAEQFFSLAGYIGGGAILNVESHEELDTITSQFPYGPFSTMEVYALGDLSHSLAESKKVTQQWQAQR